MNRCFQLAKKGLGRVSPNPLVGSVIVADNKIIGEGWHKLYGGAHAEVNAVQSVSEQKKHLLKDATLYVNLEPCNHHGKTPPCVNLILENDIPEVVICNVDSNPLVGGKGVNRLQKNGIKVITGILQKQGRFLNRRFFTMIEKKRPYIILKWAQTTDGFLAKNDSKQHWITTELSRRIVHKWRSEEDAILVGTNTAKIDNPSLTNRYFETKKQPVKILIDRRLEVSKSLKIFHKQSPTIIVNEQRNDQENHLQYCQFKFDKNLIINILQKLTEQSIQSVIIEGGARTLQEFIHQNLWDEARILTGNVPFHEGLKAPPIAGQLFYQFHLDTDTISIFKNPS